MIKNVIIMSSKTKNYLQTQLFPDEDIKQPKHDDIMFWLDKNINAITEEILPKDISKYINKYEKENINNQINRTKEYFRRIGTEESIENIKKLDNLNLFNKEYIRTVPINIELKNWEFPVTIGEEKYKRIIGFVDMFVGFYFPTSAYLQGIVEEIKYGEIVKYRLEDTIGLNFHRKYRSVAFEVKTKIDSVGELIRQINYYRNVLRDTIFVVISENDEYKDILNIYRFAKSSSTCDVTYNNSVYKGIPYPGKLKEGEYNDDIFYYDKEKDILFVGKIEYKIVYILSCLSFFFLLLWIKNIRKS